MHRNFTRVAGGEGKSGKGVRGEGKVELESQERKGL